MINKKLLGLVTYLIEENLLNQIEDENDDEEDKKMKKDKEEKINLKIDLLDEFISVIKNKV